MSEEFKALMGRLSESVPELFDQEFDKAQAARKQAERKALAAQAFKFAAINAEDLLGLGEPEIHVEVSRENAGASYFRDVLKEQLATLLPQAITATITILRDQAEVNFAMALGPQPVACGHLGRPASPAKIKRLELAEKIREWVENGEGWLEPCVWRPAPDGKIAGYTETGPFEGLRLLDLADILSADT